MDDARDLETFENKENTELPSEAQDSPQALTAERDRLLEERNALYDQLLRQRAEFENIRKRTEREKNEFYQHAAFDVVREILPVLDALERALKAAPDDGSEFHAGIELIARQLSDALARFGVQPVKTRGQKFDPNVHQAVESVETDEYEDQTILEEWQRGYTFKGRLLRPAMVKVAVRREPAA